MVRYAKRQKSFRIAAVDLVSLKIAPGRGKEWRADSGFHGASRQIADGVLTFGGPTLFHVDQQGRSVCGVRLGKYPGDDARRVESGQRRIAQRRYDLCALADDLGYKPRSVNRPCNHAGTRS